MADEADISQARMEKEAELREQHRQRMSANRLVSENCEECGEFIPQARQQITGGTCFCVGCAEKAETKGRHYR